jgi:hypothetical protein
MSFFPGVHVYRKAYRRGCLLSAGGHVLSRTVSQVRVSRCRLGHYSKTVAVVDPESFATT